MSGRRRPERRQEAIHGRVLAVALQESRLAGDVVDVCEPVLRETCAEGEQGEELGDDLKEGECKVSQRTTQKGERPHEFKEPLPQTPKLGV